MKTLQQELNMAITKYGEDHIDIILNTQEGTMYGIYHSTNNSFNVTKDYPLQTSKGINLADQLNIGWSEV